MATSAVASQNPLVSRASSTRYSMVSSSLESNSTANSFNFKTRGKLYRQITPRKKVDRFGVDKTDYKAFFLSSTVFLRAVRTTLLAEMQEVNPHKCGFDIVERRQQDGTYAEDKEKGRHIDLPTNDTTTACTTRTHSAVNAPPPTAVMSMTDRSMQSAPVVAINILERSVGSQEDAHEKDRRGSSSFSRETTKTGNGKSLSPNKPKSSSKSSVSAGSHDIQNSKINEHEDYGSADKGQDCELDDKALDEKARAQIEKIKRRLEEEKDQRRNKPKSRAIPRLTAFSSAEATRLIKYHWMSREDRLAIENETGGDIRDPLYLNTFFPDERPVRFHKTSLPTVRKSSQKARPWTVKEKTANARVAAALKHSATKPVKSAGTYKSSALPRESRAAARSTGNIARRSVGGWRGQGQDEIEAGNDVDYPDDDDFYEEDDGYGGVIQRRSRKGPLLEVRPFLAAGIEGDTAQALGDQRNKLRGKDGCLNSRVKQCVRFVRYRERQDKQGDDRPMKAEAGKYRPMSKTDFTDHRPPNPPPSPEQKMQRSVDAYRKYVNNIAMQTKYVASKSTPGKYQTPQPGIAFKNPLALTSSRLSTRASNSNLASGGLPMSMLDADSIVVRSVMDSNLPDMVDPSGIIPSTPGRHMTSAIYAKDAVDVSQALAIRRISPKLSTNRIVAGTRGVVAQDQSQASQAKEETPRWATLGSDDGEDMGETTPTNAIVVPQATKSECLSEYSIVVDKEERA